MPEFGSVHAHLTIKQFDKTLCPFAVFWVARDLYLIAE